MHPEGEAANLGTQQLALKTPTHLQLVVPPKGGMPAMPKDSMTAQLSSEDLADATITVENPRGVPVTVFAEPGTYDVRLGQVPARSRLTLSDTPEAGIRPEPRLVALAAWAGCDRAGSRDRPRAMDAGCRPAGA